MSKSKAFVQKHTRSRGGRRLKLGSLWAYMLVGGLALAVVVGLSVYFSRSGESSPAASSPSSGAPLNVAATGNPAPGFSLPNQYGQTYTLTPGDGKNHVLVFYMGNF
jgi:cytochrome oxidase Cu insertion factor (SCO1/SenC/PrrC family)